MTTQENQKLTPWTSFQLLWIGAELCLGADLFQWRKAILLDRKCWSILAELLLDWYDLSVIVTAEFLVFMNTCTLLVRLQTCREWQHFKIIPSVTTVRKDLQKRSENHLMLCCSPWSKNKWTGEGSFIVCVLPLWRNRFLHALPSTAFLVLLMLPKSDVGSCSCCLMSTYMYT